MAPDDFDGWPDTPDRCTAVLNRDGEPQDWRAGAHVSPWYRCEHDAHDDYTFERGQVRLCREHGEAYEQARLQDMGVFDDGKEWKGWSE